MKLSLEQQGNFEEAKKRVAKAIEHFEKNDLGLLDRDANERSITHKLAEYLQQEYPDYHVDCEYNRRGTEVKRLLDSVPSCTPSDTDAVTVYPDIIVHRRGEKQNLLVIEAKKSNSKTKCEFDRSKLGIFTQPGEYEYDFGLLLIINLDESRIEDACWYHAGKPIERDG
ncbi:MAG: hypothetical protein ABIH23_31845 [bacterium]